MVLALVTGVSFATGLVAAVHADPTARTILERRQLTRGEPVQWAIVLENAGTAAPEAEIPPLDWARVQEAGTSRNVSWVNGRFSSTVSYQFLLIPEQLGRHQVPAVSFQVGHTRVSTEPIVVDVLPSVGGVGAPNTPRGGRLRLIATVDHASAVVGEPVRLTVRFYQGIRLRSDPQYRSPDAPGFWSEPASVPRSYYVEQGGSRWLVSEARTVLYPTVAGRLRVGPAKMVAELATGEDSDELDPLSSLFGGRRAGEVVEIESEPLGLDVVPSPLAGRPAGYQGAVGDFRLVLSADRTHVRADETINVTVRLVGTGGLRLAAAPSWASLEDFQIYGGVSRDSIDLEGEAPSGAKIVEIPLLPRHRGRLRIPPLVYSTYVPGSGYRVLRTEPLDIQVDAPLSGMSGAPALTPLDVPRGISRPPTGWTGWLAAVIGLGSVVLAGSWLARRRRSEEREAEERWVRSAQATLAQARQSGDRSAYFAEAERVLMAAEPARGSGTAPDQEGEARRRLLERVRAARYAPGGGAQRLEEFGGEVEGHLRARLARAHRGGRSLAAPATALAISALLVVGGAGYAVWRSQTARPDETLVERWREAARDLAGGEGERAGAILDDLWQSGYRGGTLAAQGALAALDERRLGLAALWAERARRESPRDPFVRAVRRVLDEEGALPGHPEGLGTVVTWREAMLAAAILWALAASLWGIGSLSARPSRRLARGVGIGLSALAVLVAFVALAVWRSGFGDRGAVVTDSVPLRVAPGGKEELDLEPGRLVELRGGNGPWVRVGLGGGVEGWIPAANANRVATPSGGAEPAHPAALSPPKPVPGKSRPGIA